jgi:ABC-type amino acid transport substrate-binding protein
MRTRRFVPSLVVALIFLYGAVALVEAENWPVLERIVKTGTIRVGLSGDQAPLNVKSRSGELIGLEIDLVRMMAQSMGVTVEYVIRPFPELLPALKNGEVDMVMSGMAITAERSLDAVFVGPYMMSGKSLLTKDPALAQASRTEDINQFNLTVAALRNSTSQAFAQKRLPLAKLLTVETYDEGIHKVIEGDVDALVADMPACALAVLRFPEENLLTPSAPFTVEPVGIAIRASELSLQSLLDNYVEAYKESGLIEMLRVQWLESSNWLSKLP